MTGMPNKILRFLRGALKPVLVGLLLLLNCFAVRNLILLSSDMLRGDGSADGVSPAPVYPLLRIPAQPATLAHQAEARIGGDFAAIYFPAQDVAHLQNGYSYGKTLDPLRRPSRTAPLVIVACAVTFCRLDFGFACLLEMAFQTLLFFGAAYWAFSECGMRRYFPYGLLAINLCLFLTPAGLSWFERGQFSLYLAAAYTVLILALVKKQPLGMFIAALLAFIKWTSFPPIFVILAVYPFSSRNLRELRSNLALLAVFAVTAIVLVVLPAMFFRGTDLFLSGVIGQELAAVPEGISLLRYLPSRIVKLMPLLAIAIGYLNARASRSDSKWLIPYGAGVVGIMLTYPTLAYEYGLPSLLGFLPLLVFWARRGGSAMDAPGRILVLAYCVFLVAASFSTYLFSSQLILVELYVLFSLLLMLAPFLVELWYRRFTPSALRLQLP